MPLPKTASSPSLFHDCIGARRECGLYPAGPAEPLRPPAPDLTGGIATASNTVFQDLRRKVNRFEEVLENFNTKFEEEVQKRDEMEEKRLSAECDKEDRARQVLSQEIELAQKQRDMLQEMEDRHNARSWWQDKAEERLKALEEHEKCWNFNVDETIKDITEMIQMRLQDQQVAIDGQHQALRQEIVRLRDTHAASHKAIEDGYKSLQDRLALTDMPGNGQLQSPIEAKDETVIACQKDDRFEVLQEEIEKLRTTVESILQDDGKKKIWTIPDIMKDSKGVDEQTVAGRIVEVTAMLAKQNRTVEAAFAAKPAVREVREGVELEAPATDRGNNLHTDFTKVKLDVDGEETRMSKRSESSDRTLSTAPASSSIDDSSHSISLPPSSSNDSSHTDSPKEGVAETGDALMAKMSQTSWEQLEQEQRQYDCLTESPSTPRDLPPPTVLSAGAGGRSNLQPRTPRDLPSPSFSQPEEVRSRDGPDGDEQSSRQESRASLLKRILARSGARLKK